MQPVDLTVASVPVAERQSSKPTRDDEILRRIVSSYHPLWVFRYVQARPDQSAGAYDLLVIVRDDVPPEMRIPTMAYQTVMGLRFSGEVVVLTRRKFEHQLRSAISPSTLAVHYGVKLYEYKKT